MTSITRLNNQAGFTLLEVVLAIAVFAFGLLALIELQTGLAGSASDANLRTVAINIAEELIEDRRGFIGIDAVDNDYFEYDEIVTEGPDTYQVLRAEGEGVPFQANIIVQDYYWDADTETFVTTAPAGIVNSDYKTMDIAVMWRPLEGSETFDDHDTIQFAAEGGGVRVIEAVPSAPPVLGALVASNRDFTGNPQVDYNPGEKPEIVRITLDGEGGKFKESTTPMPDVIRDDKIETWFDVVTYSQAGGEGDAIFLRREEFALITCSCELETAPAESTGLKPTLWNGLDYTEGEKALKPIGIPAGPASQQSMFCGVCCRDHHDGAGSGAEDVYSLEFVGSLVDHPHYNVDRRGDIIPTPVGDGDEYIEACRLIRKDGFMRVTHDANQAALLGFPEGYLDTIDGVSAYSAYITESAGDYYSAGVDPFPQPNPPDVASPHEFPGRATDNATTLPTAILTTFQQLRARGVYTDYLTTAAQGVIDDCFPLEDRTEECRAPNTTTEFEIYPFFEVQLTLLSFWDDASDAGLVSVTNEPIETGNVHSRGFIELVSEDEGQSRIEIKSYKDNQGLTATGPIAPGFLLRQTVDSIYVNANGGDAPAPPIGSVVSGQLRSALRRVPAGDLLFESTGALCGHTDTEWACVVTEADAKLRISNYYLNMPRTYACSELPFSAEGVGPPAEDHYTTFDLPVTGEFDIWITDDFSECGR